MVLFCDFVGCFVMLCLSPDLGFPGFSLGSPFPMLLCAGCCSLLALYCWCVCFYFVYFSLFVVVFDVLFLVMAMFM